MFRSNRRVSPSISAELDELTTPRAPNASPRGWFSEGEGVRPVGLDAVAGDGLGHRLGLEVARLRQGGEGRHDDVLRIDLEIPPEILTGVAPPEPVRAQHDVGGGYEPGDQVGDGPDPVARSDDGALHAFESPRHVGDLRGLARMEAVPALHLEPLLPEELVAGDAPDVG